MWATRPKMGHPDLDVSHPPKMEHLNLDVGHPPDQSLDLGRPSTRRSPNQRSKNLSLSSSQAPSSPGNKEPEVMPMMLNSLMTRGLSLTGRSIIFKNCPSVCSSDRM